MASDGRLIEIVADVLIELRGLKEVTQTMAGDIHVMKSDITLMKDDISVMKNDITELKIQQAKTNIGLNEMRLSNMKLAERIEEIVHLDQRVRVLENIVLPKAS